MPHQDELDHGDEVPHDASGRSAPFGPVRAGDSVATLHGAHGFVAAPSSFEIGRLEDGEHRLQVPGVLLEGVEQAELSGIGLAFHFCDGVAVHAAFDAEDAEQREDEANLHFGETTVGERLRDGLLHARKRDSRNGGGGGSSGCRGRGRCVCHEGSDAGIVAESIPVPDEVGMGASGGLPGHCTQGA